jgi:predicted Mrr-cat superfamily restriction endonuclease
MSRYIREMKIGDLVVVPYGTNFYVAEVCGPAIYLPANRDDDTAYRRDVIWLNDKRPLSRTLARAALLSRMKIQGTCAPASDLIDEIQECLGLAAGSQSPTFYSDLQRRLIPEVLEEIRRGRMESFAFERLIQTVLIGLGAEECRIVPRQQDKGADLIATFAWQVHSSNASQFKPNIGSQNHPWIAVSSNN